MRTGRTGGACADVRSYPDTSLTTPPVSGYVGRRRTDQASHAGDAPARTVRLTLAGPGHRPAPIGAHVDSDDPLAAAEATGAAAVQFFLADPQGWKAPGEHAHAEAIRATDLAVYIHSPYVINVATTNNRIRIPSRKLLAQHAAAAAAIGAKAPDRARRPPQRRATTRRSASTTGARPSRGRRTTAGSPLPILIENTAGGDNAMARRFDRLARLWDAVGEFGVGFCLDTCHAHAGGEELDGIVDRVLAITGRIDLVHANDSRDAFDSGADRHANIGTGQIDAARDRRRLPRGRQRRHRRDARRPEGQGADIAYLRTARRSTSAGGSRRPARRGSR